MRNPFAAALFALFLGAFATSALFSDEKPVPTRFGFIDLKKAFDGYRKRKEVEDALKAKSDKIMTALKQRKTQLEQQAEKLNTLNDGTEERESLERQIQIGREELDYDFKATKRILEREANRKEAMIYREICDEAEAYRQERGLAAVLQHSSLDPDFAERVNLDLVMGTRAVLARSDDLDITADVVQRLNALLPAEKK